MKVQKCCGQSKFDLNSKVWLITKKRRSEWITCPICEGTGRVFLGKDNTDYNCPECYGQKGYTKYFEGTWRVEQELTIGRITILSELINISSNKCIYMAYETGIRSGHVYDEKDLFATKKEAQVECDKRNEKDEAFLISLQGKGGEI